MGYMIDSALGRNVIVEPHEKSTVLKAEETATVFKVVSIGDKVECFNIERHKNHYDKWPIKKDDLIIVEPNSVQKAVMGDKDVYYVKDSDVLGRVKVG